VGNICKQGEHLWLGWYRRKLGRVPIDDGLGREARVGLAQCGVFRFRLGAESGSIGYDRGSIGYLMSTI